MGSLGMPLPCTAVCNVDVGDEEGLKRVGECLSKRVEVVVCSDQEGNDDSQSSSSSSSSASAGKTSSRVSSGTAGASASASGKATASASTGGAGRGVGGQGGEFSKAGLVVFGVLALGSVVGMLM